MGTVGSLFGGKLKKKGMLIMYSCYEELRTFKRCMRSAIVTDNVYYLNTVYNTDL